MSEKIIKLENPRSTQYAHRYIFPNGRDEMTYTWKPSTEKITIGVEVPDYVYVDIRDNTTAFRKGYLIVAKTEDEEIKEEVAELVDTKVYTVKEMQEVLKGNINKIKKEITKETPKSIIEEFVKVAKDMKLDSVSKQKYLAELLGVDDMEYVFPQDEQ